MNNWADKIIYTEGNIVGLYRDNIVVDCRAHTNGHFHGEFLEGIDIKGEDGFEDWLREMRLIYSRSTPES